MEETGVIPHGHMAAAHEAGLSRPATSATPGRTRPPLYFRQALLVGPSSLPATLGSSPVSCLADGPDRDSPRSGLLVGPTIGQCRVRSPALTIPLEVRSNKLRIRF